MSSAELRVAMEDEFETSTLLDAATTHGPTTVDFTVRINPGEPAKSMRETASGGEMARIVLAIKKCLADQDRVPFLVFDEVDAEIGGRLGFEVGTKLSDVSQHHQVLIVTHLPQVAAFAHAHFKVMKTVRDGRTISGVARLAKKDAEREIAEMSVGADVDADALREARRMVRRATARD
jgi:DNA repair protein RecN (Recombination protein N)